MLEWMDGQSACAPVGISIVKSIVTKDSKSLSV